MKPLRIRWSALNWIGIKPLTKMGKSGLPGLLLLLGAVTLCQGQLYHYKTVNGVIKLDKSQADHGIKAREIQTREFGKLINPNFIPLAKRAHPLDYDVMKRHAISVPVNARRRRSIPTSDLKKKRLVEVETRESEDSKREARELSERMTLRDLKRFIKSVSHSHRDIHLYRKKK